MRLNLIVLFQRLTNQRQFVVAVYIYKEFLPTPDQTNLPLMESPFKAWMEAMVRVGGGWRRSS